MPNHPKLAALAVLIRDDHVLLVKRRNEPDAGLWGFPGGHVDFGETAMDAASRELQEETGIIGRPLRYLTNVDVIVRDAENSIQFHFLLAVVMCDYVSGHPNAQDDVSDARWQPIEDVLTGNLECSEHVDDVIRVAMSK